MEFSAGRVGIMVHEPFILPVPLYMYQQQLHCSISKAFKWYYCPNKLYCRSYRMSHIFVDVENVYEMQQIVEDIIGDAVESNTLGVIQQRRRRTRLNDRKLEKWFKYR